MDASEPVEFDLRGLGATGMVQVVQVAGSDPKAANSFEQPNAVAPANLGTHSVQGGKLSLTLPPLSFTTIHN
jgi:alpha-L-arabinofuranosidase